MQEFDIIVMALETANQKGAFTLEQSAQTYTALADLKKLVEKFLEQNKPE